MDARVCICTPNLGLVIAIFVREREYGRFRWSSERVRGSNEGAWRSRERAGGSSEEQEEHEGKKATLAFHTNWGSAHK